ncbi:hypothetical protein AAFF_G00142730 [Aldrovandia affinis]|uniref:SH2 domain-containing protein n=1 Tax=Aldrovandia affinis TaxID=143900 RepID=A0AAD7T084_9TELE|nr:hypothetical protein AAFF_G00142730 [Aldrovandia affinis]
MNHPPYTLSVAVAVLKDREPGAFLIRDSNSFHGAYGLALKVATLLASSCRGALVYHHSITPISLPCALHIPDKDGDKQRKGSKRRELKEENPDHSTLWWLILIQEVRLTMRWRETPS